MGWRRARVDTPTRDRHPMTPTHLSTLRRCASRSNALVATLYPDRTVRWIYVREGARRACAFACLRSSARPVAQCSFA